MTPSSRRFRFVQAEFPWILGPEPGRYIIREHLGEGVRWILVLRTLGAPERRLLAARRARRRDVPASPPPEGVPTSRATLIDTAAVEGGRDAAAQWLDGADLIAAADEAIARLNRVLQAHRIATADAYARELALGHAIVVRVGYGSGERVADGRWEQARELPHPPVGPGLRRAALRPQERLTALLAGRDVALACEELTLRARADLDAGRMREAALQLRAAHEAALAELEPWRDEARLAGRLDELHAHRDAIDAAAAAALQGGLLDAQIEAVRAGIGRLEAALRARTARGL